MNSNSAQHEARSPWDLPGDWPVPDRHALRISGRLVDRVRDLIDGAGGSIPLADYMEQVLYAPGLGYYSAGSRKFGPDGDFVTAPELSPLFARCLAQTCKAVLDGTGGGDILELGAGSGTMAAGLLAELERLHALPRRYRILERSAELRDRQLTLLSERIPHLLSGIEWLDRLPAEKMKGVIIGNEVLDALPVDQFAWRDGLLLERRVTWDGNRFAWLETAPGNRELAEKIVAIGIHGDSKTDYVSEISVGLRGWLAAIAEQFASGVVLFTDYGYARNDYYHPQRSGGTLMCHYRHRAHADPFLLPGLQDITAYVDFTALAEAAGNCGLDVGGFTTQAHFLMDTGIDKQLAEYAPVQDIHYLEAARQAKVMMLPGEMGERFKAMLLTRNMNVVPPGFRSQDLRARL